MVADTPELTMYDVALSLLSCVRAGTDVHVAWLPDSNTGLEAVAFTPGGGKMGDLLSGAFDHALLDAIRRFGAAGGLVSLSVGPAESLVSGLTEGTTITLAVATGTSIPEGVLLDLVERKPVEFQLELGEAQVTCSFDPVPRAVIAGSGPVAEALDEVLTQAGWATTIASGVETAGGLMATLSSRDAAIVLGHDVEVSSRALQAAIASKAGYIGSVGSRRMQESRAQWLSYQGVDWSERVHGPAGLDINASTPGEIAISIAAEAIAVARADQELA